MNDDESGGTNPGDADPDYTDSGNTDPQTGDASKLLFITGLTVSAVAGGAIAVSSRRRRRLEK